MNLNRLAQWTPPEHWLRITTLDAHTAGEPLRIIAAGYPALPGRTILERRRYAAEYLDHLRTALMWEPRGHADMYGCIITPPVTEGASFGVLFLHNEGYSTMCGHGIIAVSMAAVETGMVPSGELKIDAPAGLITARVDGNHVSFDNVPSFVDTLDASVDVPELGPVRYDLAYGGAFYAFVDAQPLGLSCTPDNAPALIRAGMQIKRAVMESRPVRHPFEADLSFLYGTIFIGPSHHSASHSRHVCVFANGEVDRSPTGTGVSARAAILSARGELEQGRSITIESILGTTFTVAIKESTEFGGRPAVIPTVGGTAHLTGRNEFWLDPSDPLHQGFWLR